LVLLLANFPNLKMLNLDNNPLSLKNLDQLSVEQLNSVVKKIEQKEIKINTWRGTIALDLLKALHELKVKENNNNNQNLQSNQQNITADCQAAVKPNQLNNNNNLLLLLPVIAGSCLVGSLFTYL